MIHLVPVENAEGNSYLVEFSEEEWEEYYKGIDEEASRILSLNRSNT